MDLSYFFKFIFFLVSLFFLLLIFMYRQVKAKNEPWTTNKIIKSKDIGLFQKWNYIKDKISIKKIIILFYFLFAILFILFLTSIKSLEDKNNVNENVKENIEKNN